MNYNIDNLIDKYLLSFSIKPNDLNERTYLIKLKNLILNHLNDNLKQQIKNEENEENIFSIFKKIIEDNFYEF